MNILEKAQKQNLNFLDDPDSDQDQEICNSCNVNVNAPSELLKCKKNSKGGGCSWTTCHECIRKWYIMLRDLSKKENCELTCPQCKAPRTFNIYIPETRSSRVSDGSQWVVPYWSSTLQLNTVFDRRLQVHYEINKKKNYT